MQTWCVDNPLSMKYAPFFDAFKRHVPVVYEKALYRAAARCKSAIEPGGEHAGGMRVEPLYAEGEVGSGAFPGRAALVDEAGTAWEKQVLAGRYRIGIHEAVALSPKD